jgi:hypothetical protein
LIDRGVAIYERVKRLDETMYERSAEPTNPVSDQHARLRDAFKS